MHTTPVTFEIHDERGHIGGDRYLERLYSGGRWVEGPVYVPSGRYLLFSDIPNDRMLRWDETNGSVGVFRSPAGFLGLAGLLRLKLRAHFLLDPMPVDFAQVFGHVHHQ